MSSGFMAEIYHQLYERDINPYCREDGDEPMLGVIYSIVAAALRSHENGKLAARRIEDAFAERHNDETWAEFHDLAAPFIEGGIAYAAEKLGLLDGR